MLFGIVCLIMNIFFLINELLVIPSLTLPVLSDFYVLQTDVSTTGLGAVLEIV